MNPLKNIKSKIAYFIGYALLMLPMCYSIYYSVPASDDFAAAIRRNGQNIIAQSARHGFGMWATWGGRWLSQFFQTLINPLNSHEHIGHKYGIYMIVVFIITTIAIIYGMRVIYLRVVGAGKEKLADALVFLTFAVLFTTKYYSECYNWFVGAMVYTIPVAFLFIAIASMIKYADNGATSNKHYAIMILAAIFPATIELYDVALGMTYLYYIYWNHREERLAESTRLKIKNILPLVLYVILGVTNVFAPGNTIRREYYQLELSVKRSFIQYVVDVVLRVQSLIIEHPFLLFILAIVVVLGIVSNKEHVKTKGFLATIIMFGSVTTGSLFPYIYSRAFTTTYLDIRMEYILDYCLQMCFVMLALHLGRFLAFKYELTLTKQKLVAITSMLVMFVYITLIQNYGYMKLVQYEIFKNKGLIQYSYAFWDGVITEIENSPEDNVVIHRDEEPTWTWYFFPLGLVEGDVFNVDYNKIYDENLIMPNVYYEKESIEIIYDNNQEVE